LAIMGVDPVVAPLLAVRDLPGPIELASVGALAFTSANAVAAFARGCADRHLPVFAVGAATATAAGAAGFADITASDGDVEALASLIIAHGEAIGAILHPGAAEPAGDLVGRLQGAGRAARALAIYETVAVAPPAAFLAGLDSLAGVLLHSPRAAGQLAGLLRDRVAPALAAYCLSPAIAAVLEGLQIGQIRVAALPNEDALLSLVASRQPR
jgi:uroporphyrinogen-III synthase